ncbi:DUF4145 domain-containing protein [Fibrella forsythiae]|uniref:DUF4145 domain-containing protein n=1 Tax=Fibrella forsythiae TaxID=2817061 RepID=A0ABS3JSI8_9BACT|nr:DUF4145 domain-containing protein [Fibrella forsythiae]MBO0951857.1 DUF4145 domain-containing protein [Fibrella forsythiae]
MLRHIPQQCYVVQTIKDNYNLPVSIDTTCPHCRRRVNLSLPWDNPKTYVVEHCQAHCPACQKSATLILMTDSTTDKGVRSGNLFITPNDDIRQPLTGVAETNKIEEGLKRAYFSTINVLNAQEWTATTILSRRVLEGITKSVIAEEHKNKNLPTQIRALLTQIDLSKPISTLADAIRQGGTIGAHFDLEKEPNQEIASLMVDLLDDLMEYIFILPGRIQQLHDKMEKLSGTKPVVAPPHAGVSLNGAAKSVKAE